MGLKPGDSVLGRYEVLGLLGRGGMGEVHRGRHQVLGQTVALKVLTDTSAETEKRFLREAKLMALVRSPYIVAILDFGHTPDNLPCIAMEFIEGEELGVRLRRLGALPWMEAVMLARDIAHGLNALHAVDVLHRDLKPGNVVVAPGPPQLAKIIDFGIARPTGNADATRMTSTGALIGTPAYMAPEQLLGLALDGRSDLYAVGLILHEMLTGELPFPGRDMAAVIRRLQVAPPPAVAPEGRPPLPPALVTLVQQCLAGDPTDRPASAADLVVHLDALLRPHGQQTSAVHRAVPDVDVSGATGIAPEATAWPQTSVDPRPASAPWTVPPPQYAQQPAYPPQPQYPQQPQFQPPQQYPAQTPSSGAYPVMWAPVMQPQMIQTPQGWVQAAPQAWPYPTNPQYTPYPPTTPAPMPPWAQTPYPPQQPSPSGTHQIGPSTVPGAGGVRYLVVVKLPPSKLAVSEERRWLASILGHHGRSFTFGSQFWFALQNVASPANDAGVAARGIIQKLGERYPNQASHRVRFMPAEFALNAAQLTGAQPLPADLAEMLNELG